MFDERKHPSGIGDIRCTFLTLLPPG